MKEFGDNILAHLGMKPLGFPRSVPVKRGDILKLRDDIINEATTKATLATHARQVADVIDDREIRLTHLLQARRFEQDTQLYMEWVGILESWIE